MTKEARPTLHALHKTLVVLTTISGTLLTEKDSSLIEIRIYKTPTPGIRFKIGKAMITVVTSEIAGSGSLLVLFPIMLNAPALQVSIDYNNKKIFYKYLPLYF
jgi:hypothetical protein